MSDKKFHPIIEQICGKKLFKNETDTFIVYSTEAAFNGTAKTLDQSSGNLSNGNGGNAAFKATESQKMKKKHFKLPTTDSKGQLQQLKIFNSNDQQQTDEIEAEKSNDLADYFMDVLHQIVENEMREELAVVLMTQYPRIMAKWSQLFDEIKHTTNVMKKIIKVLEDRIGYYGNANTRCFQSLSVKLDETRQQAEQYFKLVTANPSFKLPTNPAEAFSVGNSMLCADQQAIAGEFEKYMKHVVEFLEQFCQERNIKQQDFYDIERMCKLEFNQIVDSGHFTDCYKAASAASAASANDTSSIIEKKKRDKYGLLNSPRKD